MSDIFWVFKMIKNAICGMPSPICLVFFESLGISSQMPIEIETKLWCVCVSSCMWYDVRVVLGCKPGHKLCIDSTHVNSV